MFLKRGDKTAAIREGWRTFSLLFINFSKTFIPARRRLSFVDVSIRRFAFEGSISAGALQNRSREGGGRRSLSLSLSLFNGYPAERLAKRHNVSPFKAGPARMQRPGVDVTRIGETRSTAHANAQATKIWNVNWSNVCNTERDAYRDFVEIQFGPQRRSPRSWRFRRWTRGGRCIYMYVYVYMEREGGFGFDSNVYRLAVNRASKENGQWAR